MQSSCLVDLALDREPFHDPQAHQDRRSQLPHRHHMARAASVGRLSFLGRKVSSNIDREAGTALWRRTRMRSSAQPPSEATDECKTNASADPSDTPVAAVELRGFEGHLAVICRQTRTAVSNLNSHPLVIDRNYGQHHDAAARSHA